MTKQEKVRIYWDVLNDIAYRNDMYVQTKLSKRTISRVVHNQHFTGVMSRNGYGQMIYQWKGWVKYKMNNSNYDVRRFAVLIWSFSSEEVIPAYPQLPWSNYDFV